MSDQASESSLQCLRDAPSQRGGEAGERRRADPGRWDTRPEGPTAGRRGQAGLNLLLIARTFIFLMAVVTLQPMVIDAIGDAILYVARTGCAWRQLPVNFPPWQTEYWYFNRWEQAKVTEKILPVVCGRLRIQEGRNAEPSAGLIDSQSVKGSDTVGQDSRGYDTGKKINGRKRFIVTDTLCLLLCVVVLSAGVQDRDDAKPVLLDTYLRTPVRFVFADGGFAGRLLDWATTILGTTPSIVRKPADQRGFAVIPRRWAVERTFAWITAHRRLARDYERRPAHSEAMIRWAAINTITRRIARGGPAIHLEKRIFTPST